MKNYRLQRSAVMLAAVTLSAVILGCYAQGTRGTLVLYKGARRSADSVATIVVASGISSIITAVGDRLSLRDTLEMSPGWTTIMLGPTSRQSARTYWGPSTYHSRLQRLSRGTRMVTSATVRYRCWELSFDAQAGHVYDLMWDTVASHDVELVLVDRTVPSVRIRAVPNQACY